MVILSTQSEESIIPIQIFYFCARNDFPKRSDFARQNHCAVILTKVSVRQNHCVGISHAKVSYKQRIPVNFAGSHSGTEFFIQESNIQAFS